MTASVYDTLPSRYRRELKAASAIAPDVATERAYQYVQNPRGLPRCFSDRQRTRSGGLLIPIRDTSGEIATYQLKPDTLRQDATGKVIKYELPEEARMCLDVPRRVQPLLGDPAVPLWITEGSKKVDSALSNGIPCIIGLLGVACWKGTNARGGKTALPGWHDVALNGREVIIAFDSDVMVKERVRGELERLSGYLNDKGATVRYCIMPPLGNGGAS